METNHSNLFLYGSGRFFIFYDDILKEISIQDEGYIYDFAFDSDGSLWLTTPNLIRLDEEFNLVEYNSETVLHDILYDGSQLWGFTDIQQDNSTENQLFYEKMNPIGTFQIHESRIYIHFNAHVTSKLETQIVIRFGLLRKKTNIYIKKVIACFGRGVWSCWPDVDSQGRLWVGEESLSVVTPSTDLLPLPTCFQYQIIFSANIFLSSLYSYRME